MYYCKRCKNLSDSFSICMCIYDDLQPDWATAAEYEQLKSKPEDTKPEETIESLRTQLAAARERVKEAEEFANTAVISVSDAQEQIEQLTERAVRAEKLLSDLKHLVIMSDGSGDAMALFRYSDQAGQWVSRNYEGRCAIVPVETYAARKEVADGSA